MGVSWSQAFNILNPLAESGSPDIIVDGAGNIYIVYTGSPTIDPVYVSADIYFTGSTH